MKGKPLSVTEVRKMFSNPMYCLPKVQGWEVKGGAAIIDRETWIKAAVQSIKQSGSEQFLRDLLDNLEGNYE